MLIYHRLEKNIDMVLVVVFTAKWPKLSEDDQGSQRKKLPPSGKAIVGKRKTEVFRRANRRFRNFFKQSNFQLL